MDPAVEELEIGVGEQVRREAEIPADAERAWEAITEPEMLERWLADEVEMEAVEGAPASFTVDGEERHGRVERVVEGRELAFTWERESGDASLVRFELTPCVSGTRVVVTETRLGPGTVLATAAGWSASLMHMSGLATLVRA